MIWMEESLWGNTKSRGKKCERAKETQITMMCKMSSRTHLRKTMLPSNPLMHFDATS